MSLAELKKQQNKMLEKLVNDVTKIDNPQGKKYDDDRFWKPVRGSDGNGSATIRFLPPSKGEDVAFVHYYSYSFKGPTGKFYIEKALTNLSKEDPVVKYKAKLRAAGKEDDAKKLSRLENYITNILVIKDPANPENDGKVLMFRFGKKIFEKLKSAMMGDEDLGREGINIFDPWEGKNFVLKIKTVSSFANYDDSTFVDKSAPIGKDDYIENVWNQQHSLTEHVAEEAHKSYGELEKRLFEVLDMDAEPSQRKTDKPAEAVKNTQKTTKKVEDDVPFDMSDTESSTDIDELLKGIDLG